MARLVRVVPPGHPHLITQRGNRRQSVFFRASDYADWGASSNLAKAIGESAGCRVQTGSLNKPKTLGRKLMKGRPGPKRAEE